MLYESSADDQGRGSLRSPRDTRLRRAGARRPLPRAGDEDRAGVPGRVGRPEVRRPQAFLSAASDAERQSAVALYKGLRFIDYGMDLTFDTFFFTAWVLLGASMLRHRSFGRVFGGAGIILFALAAATNLRAAPDPPARLRPRPRRRPLGARGLRPDVESLQIIFPSGGGGMSFQHGGRSSGGAGSRRAPPPFHYFD